MQAFHGSLAKILDSLGFLAKKSKNFLGFLSTILKNLQNLANLAKNNCQDLGKKCQKSKNFLGKKSKIFLGSLAKILDSLGFPAKKCKNFLGFLSTILKNLANLTKNNCQDLGKKFQKSKKFLGKKTKTPSTGQLMTLMLFRMII